MKKYISCDCTCADACPQGRIGSGPKCSILKEEKPNQKLVDALKNCIKLMSERSSQAEGLPMRDLDD